MKNYYSNGKSVVRNFWEQHKFPPDYSYDNIIVIYMHRESFKIFNHFYSLPINYLYQLECSL